MGRGREGKGGRKGLADEDEGQHTHDIIRT